MRRLIIRPGAIGDCILALPAMESLKADYTEVWVAGPNVPLIRFADRVRSIASTGLDLVGIPGYGPKNPGTLRASYAGPSTCESPRARSQDSLAACFSSFDLIVSWYGYAREDFRAAVAQFPFQFLPALPPKESRLHAADFFLRQVGGPCYPAIPRVRLDTACGAVLQDCGGPPGPPSAGRGRPTQAWTPAPRGHPSLVMHDYVVIHPFSGSPKKNWPLERYRELACRLNCREGTDYSVPDPQLLLPAGIPGVDRAVCPLLWCAGPEEELDDAVRFENLYDLACWLAGARLYIGNDSGITHLAAAVGAPVVALFGPTDPAIWGPRGDRVSIVATALPGEPMETIPLEAVWSAARTV